MKTKARLVAETIRLKQWSQQICECQNRPASLTMDDWCRQQGITKVNYYYRLRRVRQAILNYSVEENSNRIQIPDFVELPVPADCLSLAIPREQTMPEKSAASAVIRGNSGIAIDVFPKTSPELLHTFVWALAHAE